MSLHPEPAFRPIPVKAVIPGSLGTRSQRINPWIPAAAPAATVCRTDAGYELKEARIGPNCQSFRVLTGRERKRHFGLTRLDPERPCPTVQKSVGGSTTALVHPYEVRRLTISEVKLVTSFPPGFEIAGRFEEKWAVLGNSVPPLMMRAIGGHILREILRKDGAARHGRRDGGGASGGIGEDGVLPEPEHAPARPPEAAVGSPVARDVRRELRDPIAAVGGRGPAPASRAAVPEAPVDEDGQARAREDDVRPGSGDPAVHEVPPREPCRAEMPAQAELRAGVPPPYRRHDPGPRGRVEDVHGPGLCVDAARGGQRKTRRPR